MNEDEDSQVAIEEASQLHKTEPNFIGRFSTAMSERDNYISNFGQESNAFHVLYPRNFSQAHVQLPA